MRPLIIVRPEPGASATVAAARALGLDALAMPLFKVEPMVWTAPDPDGFDALLLTSANAVRHGGEGLGTLRGLPVHAVGRATADAAQEAGFTIATVGDSGVDQLLESIPPGARLLHLCGEHRKAAQAVKAVTGVTGVTGVTVYRSQALPAQPEFAQIEGQVIAVHSPRAGQLLAELAEQQQIDRSRVRIAAISAAAALAAGGGWDVCEACERPDDASLLALAARLCDKPGTP